MSDIEDDEANAFAFALLMPESFMRAEIAKVGRIDIDDERAVKVLANKFRVSKSMMLIRLGQLARVR